MSTEKRRRFVAAYAIEANATKAATRAGFSPATSYSIGHALLKDVEIVEAIRVERERLMAKVNMDAEEVLRQWVMIATADPAKITRTRYLNCRHCWGVGNEYQWSAREYAAACDQALAAVDSRGRPCPQPPPSCSGGFGWKFNEAPNPECPECQGEGKPNHWVCDMDTLEPAERRLIAGVKSTKDGIEVKMRDQTDAVLQISKYLGMITEKRELTGKDGAPLHAPVTAEALAELRQMTPEQLRVLASRPLKDET